MYHPIGSMTIESIPDESDEVKINDCTIDFDVTTDLIAIVDAELSLDVDVRALLAVETKRGVVVNDNGTHLAVIYVIRCSDVSVISES
jgi:hypothetical protein